MAKALKKIKHILYNLSKIVEKLKSQKGSKGVFKTLSNIYHRAFCEDI